MQTPADTVSTDSDAHQVSAQVSAELSAELPNQVPAQADEVDGAAIRRHAANVAKRLLPASDPFVDQIDWTALHDAPVWLGLDEQAFIQLQARLGVFMHLTDIRLWIDQPRLAAAGALAGAQWLRSVCSANTIMPMPSDGPRAAIDGADAVAGALRHSGATLMIAALPAGALRDALAQAWSVSEQPAVNAQLAEQILDRALQ